MTDLWTAAGKRWDHRMARLFAELREHDPKLWTQVGHDTRNERFPLRAWASLSRDGTPNEDLAVSLDFTRVPGGVACRVEIAHGDGNILAEAPVRTIEITDDAVASQASVSEALDVVDAFLEANHDLLVGELSRRADRRQGHG